MQTCGKPRRPVRQLAPDRSDKKAPSKGFFSIIQFCPDLYRGECANIGVEMKLWLVRRKDRVGWDEVSGFVIRAVSSASARKLASENAADEGCELWLNPALSNCTSIAIEGAEAIILKDGLNG